MRACGRGGVNGPAAVAAASHPPAASAADAAYSRSLRVGRPIRPPKTASVQAAPAAVPMSSGHHRAWELWSHHAAVRAATAVDSGASSER